MAKIKKQIYWYKGIAVTLLLIFVLNLASFLVIHQINDMEENYCFDTLHQEASRLADNIITHVNGDRSQLEVIANMISTYDEVDSAEVRNLLKTYCSANTISHLEILFPDDTVLLQDGTKFDAKNILSYEKEAASGWHLSNIEPSLTDADTFILRHYVPIVQDGETKAMLYGVISLEDLQDFWKADAYDGNASIYVIDGNTGEFIIDTWHKERGDIWGLGEREMKKGYTPDLLTEGVINGDKGHVVFISKTTGQYLYFYYEPMELNSWRIGLSVPENIVFQNAVIIKGFLRIFTLFEGICFFLYFIWMVFYVKTETKEKQRQLERVNYIYDIEKILFTAHQKRGNIEQALHRISDMTTADCTYFRVYQDEKKDQIYVWTPNDGFQNMLLDRKHFPFLDKQDAAILYKENTLKQTSPEQYAFLEQCELHSLMVTQIRDTEHHVVGILGATNMKRRFESAELLQNVAYSFSMLCQNVKTYAMLKDLGEKDSLTGLLNRNSFELAMEKYQYSYENSLVCIYVDVNGLHELNNTKGHGAGDQMLRSVAIALQSRFGTESTFRIGGDEFLVFSINKEETVVSQLVQEVKETLHQEGYSISIGVTWKHTANSVDELVRKSEQKMYADKKQYYARNKKEKRKNHLINADK